MPPEDNSIKPGQPTGPAPPSYDLPITVGHQPVMDKPAIESNDGSTAIPVTVNHSFTPRPEPGFMGETPVPEPSTSMAPTPSVPADPRPLQAKIDAHPLFQTDGYNPQPPAPVPGSLPVGSPSLSNHDHSQKLLWLILILIVLLGGYVAVDILTNTKLPFELF